MALEQRPSDDAGVAVPGQAGIAYLRHGRDEVKVGIGARKLAQLIEERSIFRTPVRIEEMDPVRHAAVRPMQIALVQGQRSVTWGQFDAMVDRVAASLQRDGLKAGDALAVCAANSLEYAAVFLGGLRAGEAFSASSDISLC